MCVISKGLWAWTLDCVVPIVLERLSSCFREAEPALSVWGFRSAEPGGSVPGARALTAPWRLRSAVLTSAGRRSLVPGVAFVHPVVWGTPLRMPPESQVPIF